MTEVRRYTDAAGATLVGKTTYGRDDAGRLTSIHHKEADNDTIDHIQYVYNAANNVTQETSTNGPTRNYSYDVTHQLTGDGTNTYSFDLAGNRNSSGYSTGTGNRISSDGTWNFTWDDEGNLTQRVKISTTETWNYFYDHNNRLTKAERKPTTSGSVDLRVEFEYDVFGNRIERTVDADGDGSGSATSTKHAFDPDRNTWADLSSSGSLTTRRFFEDAIDAVFARMAESTGEEDWYLRDRLGSVRDIIDDAGTLIDNIDYDSFGKVIDETNPSNGDRFKFTARELDADIELYDYRTRYYAFNIGIFTSEDPIGFAGGTPNVREYVGNNPTNATDPTGLSPPSDGPAGPTLMGTLRRTSGPSGLAGGAIAGMATAYEQRQRAIDEARRAVERARARAAEPAGYFGDNARAIALAEAEARLDALINPPPRRSPVSRPAAAPGLLADAFRFGHPLLGPETRRVGSVAIESCAPPTLAGPPSPSLGQRLESWERLDNPPSYRVANPIEYPWMGGLSDGDLRRIAEFEWNQTWQANRAEFIMVHSGGINWLGLGLSRPAAGRTLHRPYLRVATVREILARARRAPDGRFLDANTGEAIDGTPHIGHRFGHEFWRERAGALREGMTQRQFNDYMNNPDFYQLEAPRNNLSHRFEMPW